METENKQEMNTPDNRNKWERWHEYHHRNSRSGRIMAGIVVVVAGSVWLAKRMGAEIPDWMFSWQMLLIVFGIFLGAKHAFKTFGWVIIVAIGTIFLVGDIYPGMALEPYLWPILIITAGVLMIFKPKRRYPRRRWRRWEQKWEQKWQQDYQQSAFETDEKMDLVSVFGSIKKNIISKDFKGGEVTCVFGGAELNLSQSDINGTVSLEVNQVFGGSTIVIPANWQLRSEMVTVLGSIEDKRAQNKDAAITDKILVIRGTSIFGGIEIRNY